MRKERPLDLFAKWLCSRIITGQFRYRTLLSARTHAIFSIDDAITQEFALVLVGTIGSVA